MTYKKGFAISVLSLALSTSAFALSGTHREWRDNDRDDHRVNHVDRDHDHDHHPNGWNKGKKEGWDHRRVPPGQVKKVEHHDRDHDRDRYRASHRRPHHNHRIVARKPVPVKPRPVSQVDKNRAWGDNVQARKAEIQQQQQAQKQGPYIKH